MKTRAFVIEPCHLDLTKAAEHGEINYLFRKGDKRASIWVETFKEDVLNKLVKAKYDPEIDFIVVAGHMITLTLTVSTLVSRYGSVRVLFYDSISQGYVPRILGDTAYGEANGPAGSEGLHGIKASA